MVNDFELFKALAQLRDSLEAGAMALDQFIQLTGKTATKEYDTSKIVWQNKDGQKGSYEMATKKDNESNQEYIVLNTDLKEHNGKLFKDGLYYWLFQDGDAIGRKKIVKK